MANGTVNGNKINVTGFISGETDERLYKVSVSGTSVAELSAGKNIKSNFAKVLHQEYAEITLSSGSTPCSGYDYSIDIHYVNVEWDTIQVSSYPSMVSSYILIDGMLCYNLYPNYQYEETDVIGSFSVGGNDKYGNLIYAEPFDINPGTKYVWGSISWEEGSGTTVSSTETSGSATYNLSEFMEGQSIEIIEMTGDFLNVELYTGGTDGIVFIYFPPNRSRNFEKKYTIKLTGKDVNGVTVVSDVFTITQGMAEGSPDFYLTGNDIEYTETAATFNIIYQRDKILPESIAVYYWSSETIIEEPSINEDRDVITVKTNVNESASQKNLIVTICGSTVDGHIMFADGIIIQNLVTKLVVFDASGTTGTSVTSSTQTQYYQQTRTFNYIAVNAGNLSASFVGCEGVSVTINTRNNTVTATIPRNESEDDKIFTIKLSSTSGLYATYTFCQTLNPTLNFTLEGGSGVIVLGESVGEISYDTTAFTMNVLFNGNGLRDVYVALNSSDSQRFRIKNIEVGGDIQHVVFNCETYANTDMTQHVYQIQASALTPENTVIYSNIFTIKHFAQSGYGAIVHAEPSSVVVGPEESLYSNIRFYCTGISSVFVDGIDVSDGSFAEVTDLQFTPSFEFPYTGVGSYSLTFDSYPESEKTIAVSLVGRDTVGEIYVTENRFTITQNAAEQPSIIIPENPITLNTNVSGVSFTYTVEYTGIDPETIGQIYDENIFSNVTNSGATIIVSNEGIGPDSEIVYQIVFSGISLNTGIECIGRLFVIQPGRECTGGTITISSDETYLDSDTGKYIIDVNGGLYALNVEIDDYIDYTTLVCETSNPEFASGTSSYVSFDTPPTPRTRKYGSVSGDTVTIPVANDSMLYSPTLLTIEKEGDGPVIEDAYVFYAYIPPYEIDVETSVRLVGQTYCGERVESNQIYFVQRGTPSDEEEE